jgi:hypothetical protein
MAARDNLIAMVLLAPCERASRQVPPPEMKNILREKQGTASPVADQMYRNKSLSNRYGEDEP